MAGEQIGDGQAGKILGSISDRPCEIDLPDALPLITYPLKNPLYTTTSSAKKQSRKCSSVDFESGGTEESSGR